MARPEAPIAAIVHKLLIDLDLGSFPIPTPGDGDLWPTYISQEPDKPDNVVTVYDTAGITEGRIHITGFVPEQFGILIRVRSADYLTGWQQMNKIVASLDEDVYRVKVEVDSALYTVHALTRRSAINSLGRQQEGGDREAFTINYTVSLSNL